MRNHAPANVLWAVWATSALACAAPGLVNAPTAPAPTVLGTPGAPATTAGSTDTTDDPDDEDVAIDGNPCASTGPGLALSSGAQAACSAPSSGAVFVPAVAEMTLLEDTLEHSVGASRAPILRRLAELEFAWECDASRTLKMACTQLPPQPEPAEAFRRVTMGARRAAVVHCAELRTEHPTFPDQCP
jgi:hypothetical protein